MGLELCTMCGMKTVLVSIVCEFHHLSLILNLDAPFVIRFLHTHFAGC